VTVAIVIVLVIASLIAFHWYQIGQQEREQLVHAQQIVASHAEELTVKRKQLTVKMSYGLVDTSKWVDEMAFFIRHVVSPEVGAFRGENLRRVYEAIESATSLFDSLTPQLSPAMDAVEYERFVAALLSSRGWDTRLTKGSGDQGVDVIAEKQGVKAVIQCKLYSYPVGNDAVQQVIAGRTFYNGHVAAVVTNATFTSSARQLASAAHVLLLHHDEVGQLDREAGTTAVSGEYETALEALQSRAIPHADSEPTGGGPAPGKRVIRATGIGITGLLVVSITGFVLWRHYAGGPAVFATEGATGTPMAAAIVPGPLAKPVHHNPAPRPRVEPAMGEPAHTEGSGSPSSVEAAEASQNVQPIGIAPSAIPSMAGGQAAKAVTPVNPAAYKRCMDFLRFQGPEGHPGEYSAACATERQ